MLVWLTLMMISEPPPPPPPSPDVAHMEAEIVWLRAMVAKLMDQRGACAETKETKRVEPPASPPAAAPPLSPADTVKASSDRGSISGSVVLEGVSAKVAYVYVADVKDPPFKGPVAVIRQKGLQFVPDHLVVRAGTRIEFPNDDKEHHHVFSVAQGNAFDLGYARTGAAPSQLFAAPGLVDINCNVHQAMNATVLVVPSRHWTKVGAGGSFTLTGVRNGKHTLRAWAPGTAIAEASVTVDADRTEPVLLKLVPKAGRRQRVYP
jgi:plastocyanin